MKLKYGAGALATAALAVAALMGAGAGARAEAEAQPTELVVPASDTQAPAADLPRFYASEVVQPLPEQAMPENAASLPELVAAMPADAELSRDLHCLAQGIYFESRGEPLTGQLAVGRVIVNRANSGLFPSDYCSVVTQPGQFSFVRGGRIPSVNEGSEAWDRARAIAQIAHRELWHSEAGDALFFHATYVRPGWANRKTARATIDRHVFYR